MLKVGTVGVLYFVGLPVDGREQGIPLRTMGRHHAFQAGITGTASLSPISFSTIVSITIFIIYDDILNCNFFGSHKM